MSKIVKINYKKGCKSERLGAYLAFSYENADKFPEGTKEIKCNNSVILMNNRDLLFFLSDLDMNIKEDDFRFVESSTLDGEYLKLTDFGYMYLCKNICAENLFIYDPYSKLINK